MPKEVWIQVKTKDGIKEKQKNDKNNAYVAKKEIKGARKKVGKMGDRKKSNLRISRQKEKMDRVIFKFIT